MKIRTLLSLIALSVIAAAPLFAASSDLPWKAGVATVVITPDQPMWMAGYATRTNTSQGKANDLYAKALALEDSEGARLVVLTLDLISVPRALRANLESALARDHALKRENLLINCSHTHSGPEFRMGRGPQDWAMFGKEGLPGAKSGEEYARELQDKLIALMAQAISNSAPAQLSYQRARCGFAMNRRTRFETNYNNFPNPEGPVDHDVPVLRVDGADRKTLALLFGYACHNTTLALYQMCGDYAGYAQEYIEKSNPGVTALFLQGCGGDQNPYPRGTFELAQQHGQALANAVGAALLTRPRPLPGPLRLAYEEVLIDYERPPSLAEYEAKLQSQNQAEARHAQRFLDRLNRGETLPRNYPYPVQLIHFGDDLIMVALAGETVVDYSVRLKRELAGPAALWIAGYCNDVMGYIPSARLLGEGGYEPHSSIFYSEIHPGPWAPSLEERIITKTHALNARLRHQANGRPGKEK